MDNVSEIYSLYSHRMGHGSGAATSDSEDLPTPLGGLTAQQNTTLAFMGPRSMPRNNTGLVRVHSSSSAHGSRYEDGDQDSFPMPPEFRSPQECGPEPYEEYFSIPISEENPGVNDARRRRSTKELIKRFESMSADNSHLYSRKESGSGRRNWSHISIRRRQGSLFLTKNCPGFIPEPRISPIRSLPIAVVWGPGSALLRLIPYTRVHCCILATLHPPRPQSYQYGFLATQCFTSRTYS